MQGVILGDDPAKTFTDDTLRSNTFDAAYTQLLTGWEESATLHSTYSQELANGIAEELRKLEKKKEETNRIVSLLGWSAASLGCIDPFLVANAILCQAAVGEGQDICRQGQGVLFIIINE